MGFKEDMYAIAEQVVRNFDDGVKHTMDVVQETVIRGCPVLTGRARNGFKVTDGVPVFAPPQMEGPFDVTGEYRIVENRKVIDANRNPSPNFYLTNTVPYVPQLNEGTSSQAPAGFIEIAIAQGIRAAKGIKVL